MAQTLPAPQSASLLHAGVNAPPHTPILHAVHGPHSLSLAQGGTSLQTFLQGALASTVHVAPAGQSEAFVHAAVMGPPQVPPMQ